MDEDQEFTPEQNALLQADFDVFMAKRARIKRLVRLGAETQHWAVTNGCVVIHPGHNDAPHECEHEDCVLAHSYMET